MTRTTFLDYRIPPPMVAGVVVGLMVLAERSSPGLSLNVPGRNTMAWILAVAGMAMAASGILSFRRRRTTVNPRKPHEASTLVMSGIYRRTRNPMYLGVTLILLGLAFGLGHPLSLLLVGLFPAYVQRFQIEPEERALEKNFGPEFIEYKARVPRWL